MSNSISLPFLIIATGTILFVYMSVVIMELRSAYEESFWKQALKIGGIIFTLITLLFLGLDFVLTRFREKAFLCNTILSIFSYFSWFYSFLTLIYINVSA